MITLVWAMDENWLVGLDDKLPWHIPSDLAHFKSITNNQIVLMGDLTYESMKGYYKNKPFPFKKVYVANIDYKEYSDAILVSDVIEFFKNNKEDVYVIGGPTIYKLALPFADNLYITYILNRYSGNVYFPKFDLSKFKVVNYETKDKLIFTKYEKRDNL